MPKSIRPYLEHGAEQIEDALDAQHVGGKITGGTVGPRLIQFYLESEPYTQFRDTEQLADALADAVDAPNLTVERGEKFVLLSFENPNRRPVKLLPLLSQIDMPADTALVGLRDDGQTVLLRISSHDACHCLVTGARATGKSTLLRTMASSLAFTQPPTLRLICIGNTFRGMAEAPHLERPIVTTIHETEEVLRSVARVVKMRHKSREVSPPRLVVFIDDLDATTDHGTVTQSVRYILLRGEAVNIHLIASAGSLTDDLSSKFPMHIVDDDGSSDAQLLGQGDFVAITKDGHVSFRSAQIFEGEISHRIASVK